MNSNSSTEFTLEQIPLLLKSHVHMKNKAVVEEKLQKLIQDGKEQLQIITDFDRTVSKHHHNGELTKSSFCVFKMVPSLPKQFIESTTALYKKFRAIEENPKLTIKEKEPYMKEWWNLNVNNFVGLKYDEKEVEETVTKAHVILREGATRAFDILEQNNIPVLVFSAGIGPVVKAIMRLNGIYKPNVHVISNFFNVTDGIIVGFQGTLIHIYNKNEHAIENNAYFEELSHRGNVILMGDSLGDASMAEGVPKEGVILKIGLLSINIEQFLPQFLENFDIVVADDQTMDTFNAILDAIL